ncbi:GtrA family protein [Geodermatophilus sp. URMC 60]
MRPDRATLRHVTRFAVVGVINTGVYYGTYLLLSTVLHYLAAHLLAIAVSMVVSFFLNCLWTFRTRPTWRKFALFPLTNATNYLLTTAGVVLLVEWLGVDEHIAPLLAAAAAIPVTFLLSRRVLSGRPAAPVDLAPTAGGR